MKKLVAFLFLPALLAVSCPSTPARQGGSAGFDYVNFVPAVPDALSGYPLEGVSGKSAFDYFKDERLSVGWNLGNTLDSHSHRIGMETVWGNPEINQEIMDGVKASGFSIIRIPVTWMGNFGPAPDYRISEDRLKRVAEVVGMANKAGLKAIINLHHDGSTESLQKEEGWLSVGRAHKTNEAHHEITLQYARAWKQIALYFQNYGDWLIFEAFNELHDGSWGNATGGLMGLQLGVIGEWNQLFTDIVRSTGGNNPQRYVVLAGYVTGPRFTLPPNFTLPEDPAENKQIVSFHYYDPYEFSIASTRVDWGSAADKQKVDGDFAPFKEHYINNNIPVIIGEAGAVRQLYPDDKAIEDRARQNRLDYVGFVFSKAKEYGLVPIYWDNGAVSGRGEKFGLFDRRTGRANMPESEAIIRAIMNAVR